MDLHLVLDPQQPLVAQLYRQLREAVLGGRLAGGERLPSTRHLADTLQVSRKTINEAYEQLLAEGFLESRVGSGTFVSHNVQRAAPRPPMEAVLLQPSPRWQSLPLQMLDLPAPTWRYNFNGGTVDMRLFPVDSWRSCLQHALRQQARSSGFYHDTGGYPPLRQAISRYLAVSRAVSCAWEDLLITQGAQQAVNLLAQVMLEPGSRVAMEEPGYMPARQCFLNAGAEVIGVPVDAEGLRVDLLPEDIRLIYVTPSHQFPLGMPLSLNRRLQLLNWARQRNVLIIEDDYDGEYRFEGRPLESLQNLDRHGLVAYLGTFSKTLYPALRLGYLLMPPGLRGALLQAKQLFDWHSDSLQQTALAQFMISGEFSRHTRRMQREYAQRRTRLLQRLHGDLSPWLRPIVPMAGIHLASWMSEEIDTDALLAKLRKRGVGLTDLRLFYQHEAACGLLLGFGCIDLKALDEGLDHLREVLLELAPQCIADQDRTHP